MKVKLSVLFVSLVALVMVQVARAQNAAPPAPPAPGDERRAEDSPSDLPPAINNRTTRGYAPGQAPGKQAPAQAPAQAPMKQAPMPAPEKQAPSAQAPMKGAMSEGGQPHVAGYAPNCANCQVSQAAPTTTTYAPRTAYRRGIFRRGYR